MKSLSQINTPSTKIELTRFFTLNSLFLKLTLLRDVRMLLISQPRPVSPEGVKKSERVARDQDRSSPLTLASLKSWHTRRLPLSYQLKVIDPR